MAKRMLIDASHPEESRVVVLQGNRIEEFDFEAAARRPLKGNIYLAKVTRVEPSLQAAFVDFGGNKHGFLAFSEIHPDYYQIPVADRQALIAQQEAAELSEPAEEDEPAPTESSEAAGESDAATEFQADEPDAVEALEPGEPETVVTQLEADIGEASAVVPEAEPASPPIAPAEDDASFAQPDGSNIEVVAAAEPEPPKPVETRPADDIDDALEEARHRPLSAHGRPYKIQEVIKRRQILLVQVVKEERGTKGAALTTYLSLAGRYCVLMPNTARGGGISRKITNQVDRKRLKSAAQELEVPQGMGLIVRTAGANRTKAEVKRDFEYLLRVWENVRDLTLKSSAPALVYEEGSLIKRAIRDLYNKDIDSILVEGEEAYKEAKTFMRTLMPSHAKVVQPYREQIPLFQRHQVESHLDSMFSPIVTLRSGGYIVINQTEALVAIDVNSGRSTRERSIEETALRTNLEAAEEAARQLRLRDLAGLIVIDFIDMEDNRNNRSVEKRLKDHLKIDRARIQIGRISGFGLLEMSRQRMRTGVLEGSTVKCPHCEGMGIVRSVESAALRALRMLEDEGIKGRTAALTLKVATNVALYILNQKRPELVAIEKRYDISCLIEGDDTLPAAGLIVNRTAQRDAPPRPELTAPVRYEVEIEEEVEEAAPDEETTEDEAVSGDAPEESERVEARGGEDSGGRSRRRRRRRGRRDHEPREDRGPAQRPAAPESGTPEEIEAAGGEPSEEAPRHDRPPSDEQGDGERRRRRRGRRGGRRNRRRDGENEQAQVAADGSLDVVGSGDAHESEHAEDFETFEAPEIRDETSPEPVEPASIDEEKPETVPLPVAANGESHHTAEPDAAPEIHVEPSPLPTPMAPEEPAVPSGPPRKGWWQRKLGI